MFTDAEKQRIKKEIQYHAAGEADLADIATLIAGMQPDTGGRFNVRSHSPEYFRWMYLQNPAGRAWVFCARHKGKLVSTFALAPKLVKIGDAVVRCGKTMDMFTDPGYQGLGLMSRLAERVFEAARRDGLAMWYVTPSGNSYPIFVGKWGYVETFEVAFLNGILNPDAIIAAVVKPAWVGSIMSAAAGGTVRLARFLRHPAAHLEASSLDCFGEETDMLWHRSKCKYAVQLVRDSRYMNWRYAANPDPYIKLLFRRNGEACGVLILKQTVRGGMKVGELVDFLCPGDGPDLSGMLRRGLELLKRDACALAQAWAIEGSAMESDLRSVGLRIKRRRFKFLFSPDAPLDLFYSRTGWFLVQGDGNDI
ncbi:MAG: GNAT family N-acetyltransferase [Deltaproteobacteria bacterium]|nr:GNAT family N-acetyltransferase [Deltaproteobacteria bacterium]